MANPARTLLPGLYIVATPIGNLGDITARAAEVLAGVDQIACEDKRITSRLLAHLGVRTRLTSYHDHNGDAARPKLLAALAEGARIALVSDAGTPLIADPGYKLVAEARRAGLSVFAVPGPSALTAALSVAGLPTDKALFAGFAPSKAGARQSFYTDLAAVPATLVVYETGRRLAASLADAAAVLGGRPASVVRELTKIYEDVVQDNLQSLARRYADAPAPKGEIVLVIGPPAETAGAQTGLDAERFLRIAADTVSPGDAAKLAAKLFGGRRNDYYARLQNSGGTPSDTSCDTSRGTDRGTPDTAT